MGGWDVSSTRIAEVDHVSVAPLLDGAERELRSPVGVGDPESPPDHGLVVDGPFVGPGVHRRTGDPFFVDDAQLRLEEVALGMLTVDLGSEAQLGQQQ